MLSRRVLGAALIGLSAIALTAGPIASASAAVEEVLSSKITSPAATTYLLDNGEPAEGGGKLTVEGTTTGTSTATVNIVCYGGEEEETLVEEVPVQKNKFKASIPHSDFAFFPYPCTLRAVPEEEPEESELNKFTGPLVAPSIFALPAPGDYEATSTTVAGQFRLEPAEACGLASNLYDPESLLTSEELFSCSGLLEDVSIDGAYGYGPLRAADVEAAIKPEKPLGSPELKVTKSFDEATGAIAIHEEDPIVKCEPESDTAPTKQSCTSFVSTGVSLVRSWETSNDNHVISMTDKWESTDGDSHTVSFEYSNILAGSDEGGRYEFPGSSTFVATKTGEAISLPSGAGTILYKSSPRTPEEETEGIFPQGAIVYSSPPSEAFGVVSGSEESGENEFDLPYQGTIPAGGSYTLGTTFIQGFALPEVRTLARDALASYYPGDHPTVTITSPANGTAITSASPAVTVTGSATDAIALSSVTVDEHTVSVASGGGWSTNVALNPGANTITATATNEAGTSKSASVTVNYVPEATPVSTPPQAAASTPPASSLSGVLGSKTVSAPATADASLVGAVTSTKASVGFTLACEGTAGASCDVHVSLSTVEKKRSGKLIAVAAAKTTATSVTVGAAKVTIAAGHELKIVITLNATGRMLLAKFGKLPVHLSASLVQSSGSSTVLSKSLTVTPPPKKHAKH